MRSSAPATLPTAPLRTRGAAGGELLSLVAEVLARGGLPFGLFLRQTLLDRIAVFHELVLHEEERGEHARADDGGGHGVTREVGHLPLRLARQEEVLDGDTLQG